MMCTAERKLSPTEQRERVFRAFEQKVQILEAWARSGVPDGAIVPRTHADLRRWTGPDGRLNTWVDPLVDRSTTGKHPDLAKRFDQAVKDIEEWVVRKKGRLPALEAENAVLKAQNERLRLQNAELIGRIDELERKVAEAGLTGNRQHR
jgi:hypothetical protein